MRASTSSPTRFINWSSRPTSSRMVLSVALCPRAPCWARSASTTSAGRAAPWSTRISPMWRGSPSFCFSEASRISAGETPARCIRMSPILPGTAAASDALSGTGAISLFGGASGACCRRVSLEISTLSSRSPSTPLASMLASIWRMASTMASRAVVISAIQDELAIPQPSQQVFADMRHGSQLVECQETRCAFDGVNRAENAGQDLAVVGTLLQRNQVPVQTVQVLVTFDQKLFDNVVGIIHGEYPLHRRAASRLSAEAPADPDAGFSHRPPWSQGAVPN